MANTIQHKRSSVSGVTPAASGLSQGELAINIADGKLYTKNSSNTVINLGVTSISGTYITPSSGNFFNYLAVNGIPVSVSGHSHLSVPQAQSLVTTVFNKTANTIPKFSAVYINGGQGDQPTIQLAIASGEGGSSRTYGITAEAITSMNTGTVIVAGALSGVNTDQFNPTAPSGDVNGSSLYLSPTVSGGLTSTKPYAPNHLVYMATIVRTHQNEGIVEVRVQNGYELEELHNVAISGVSDGQFLYYDSSTSLWKHNPNIYSSGSNIGIGTASPLVKLEVAGDVYANNVLSSGYLITNSLLSINDFDGGIPGTISVGEFTSLVQPYWTIDQNGSGNFSNLSVNDTIVSLNGHTHTSSDITNFNSSVSGLLPTIFNSGDNRVLTSTGSSVGINAETNFTFNGNLLSVTGSGSFSNNVTASGFVRSGGTSSQFLKADGGVDSTSYQPLLTNPVTGTGIVNHIPYWNSTSGIVADSGQLIWDATNNRLGIGTTAPSSILHISQNDAVLRIADSTSNAGTGPRLELNSNFGGILGSAYLGFSFYNNKTYLQHGRADTGGIELRSTNGTSRLYVQDSNGHVGIGTTSPNELLEVSGNLRLSDKAGSTGFKIQFYRGNGTANDYTICKEGNHLAISTALDSSTQRYTEFGYHSASGTWTPKTRLNNYTGALGVNLTATPSGSLDVGGDIYVRGAGTTGVMYFKSGTLADTMCKVRTDTLGSLFLDAGSYVRCGSQDGRIDMYASSQWITIGNNYDAGTANQYVRFVPANTEMMRVTKTGVGFGGVTSPLDRIHVSGIQTTIRLNNGLGYDTQLRMIDTVSDWSVGINQGNSAGSGVFSIRSVTAGSHRLVINASGSVGIGTITPTGQLHVNGTGIFSSGLGINTNNFNFYTVQSDIKTSAASISGSVWIQNDLNFYTPNETNQYQRGQITSNGDAIFNTLGVGEKIDAAGNSVTMNTNGLIVNNGGGTGGSACQLLGDYGAIIENTLVVNNNSAGSAKVGIGTSTPTHSLDVDGNIRSRALYLESVSSPSIVSSGLTLNLANSQLFTVNLNSNITTLTISNTPSTSGVAVGFSLIFTADGTARSVTWPSGIKWAGGTSPTLTSTSGKIDVLSFISTNSGTHWLGFVGGQNY